MFIIFFGRTSISTQLLIRKFLERIFRWMNEKLWVCQSKAEYSYSSYQAIVINLIGIYNYVLQSTNLKVVATIEVIRLSLLERTFIMSIGKNDISNRCWSFYGWMEMSDCWSWTLEYNAIIVTINKDTVEVRKSWSVRFRQLISVFWNFPKRHISNIVLYFWNFHQISLKNFPECSDV